MEKIDIGKIIRQGRLKKGISQKDLAKEFNITVAAISSWERNVTTPPAQILIYLAKKLDIVNDLFQKVEKKEDRIEHIWKAINRIEKKLESLSK